VDAKDARLWLHVRRSLRRADADFVNIRGEHLRGRHAIAAGHAEIFRTIYAGSTNRYTVEDARLLRPEVALVHVRALLDAPKVRLWGDMGPVSPWFTRRSPPVGRSPRCTRRWRLRRGRPADGVTADRYPAAAPTVVAT